MKWVISLTSSAWTSTWSIARGDPEETLRHRPGVQDGPPTFSTSCTTSISPDGVSKRIDSPCPTSSPLLTRRTPNP